MKTIEYTTINRAELGWPSGPWDGEPDKVQWQDDKTRLPCLAVRHPRSGHWCGYVGLNPDHPLYGQDYGIPDVYIHGGLTFADSCQPSETEATGICHLPEPGESDHVWWFGFDCAHCYDFSPSDAKRAEQRGYPFKISAEQEYRSLGYVKSQCAYLAKQLV